MPDLSVLTERSIGGLAVNKVTARAPFINMLIYGDPGAGKTVLAGSAAAVPEMSPVLFVDVEGGTYSLKSFYPDVDVVRVKTLPEMVGVYRELGTMQHDYKTVVVDSLSEVQKMIMASIMREVIEKDDERDPDVPSIREWGKSAEQVRRMVRGFRDLDMNVIFTALMDEEKHEKTGKITKYPMLPGKGKKEVAGFMDIVLYAYAKRVKINLAGEPDPDADESLHRFVLSSGTDEFVCKDRSNALPEVMLDPNMQSIHNLIQKEE